MSGLFEKSDSLNTPIECFIFDTKQEVFPVKTHWHYFAEFIYMLEGKAEMRCSDRSYTFERVHIKLMCGFLSIILPYFRKKPQKL